MVPSGISVPVVLFRVKWLHVNSGATLFTIRCYPFAGVPVSLSATLDAGMERNVLVLLDNLSDVLVETTATVDFHNPVIFVDVVDTEIVIRLVFSFQGTFDFLAHLKEDIAPPMANSKVPARLHEKLAVIVFVLKERILKAQ